MEDDPKSAKLFFAAVGRGRGPKSGGKGDERRLGGLGSAVDVMFFYEVFSTSDRGIKCVVSRRSTMVWTFRQAAELCPSSPLAV